MLLRCLLVERVRLRCRVENVHAGLDVREHFRHVDHAHRVEPSGRAAGGERLDRDERTNIFVIVRVLVHDAEDLRVRRDTALEVAPRLEVREAERRLGLDLICLLERSQLLLVGRNATTRHVDDVGKKHKEAKSRTRHEDHHHFEELSEIRRALLPAP